MTGLSTPVVRDAVAVIDATGASSAVDVGGANGALLAALLAANPALTGTVLDLPHVMPGITGYAASQGLADRVTALPGDFFESVPPADVYLLEHILHDWDDGSAVRVLRTVRAAMNPGARLYIVEMVLSVSGTTAGAALLDMVMLFATSGRERELAEYEALLSAAGLRARAVTAIHQPYHVVEAVEAVAV